MKARSQENKEQKRSTGSPYNKEAFDELFRATYPRVLAYLVKVSGQREVAEDIVQNIYLELWEHKITLPLAQNEILYYLFTTARHQFYQYTRKAIREQKELSSFTDLHFTDQQLPEQTGTILAEKEAILTKALAGIEPVKTKYFLLNKEKGISYREIAEQEGVSVKTVMRYVNSVSKQLRSRLTGLFLSLFL